MNMRTLLCVLTGLLLVAGCGEENPTQIPTTAPASGDTGQADSSADGGSDGQAAGSFTATLLITEASTAPDPQEAAYEDAIQAFGADVLSAEAGGPPKGASVGVYALAMRDRALQAPASWYPTQEVTVQVLPWAEAKRRMSELKPMYVIDELSSAPEQVWFVLPAK